MLLLLLMLIALVARVNAEPRDTNEASDIDVASDAEPRDFDANDFDANDFDANDFDASQPRAYSANDHDGQRAMHEAEQAPASATTEAEASVAAAPAGAVESHESRMRHPRPSRWGRLDLGLTWRRRWSEPMHALPHRTNEVWLVATWRR